MIVPIIGHSIKNHRHYILEYFSGKLPGRYTTRRAAFRCRNKPLTHDKIEFTKKKPGLPATFRRMGRKGNWGYKYYHF